MEELYIQGGKMKRFKRLVAGICAACLLLSLIPANVSYAAKGPESAIALGVDVSKYQGDINWGQVAASGVSFTFVRVGFLKTGIDPMFSANMRNAAASGVRTGVYIYSYANSVDEAAQEAYFVLNAIKDYAVSMPVVYDLEDSVQSTKSKEELALMANTFCAIIENAGYYPMVYASKSWFSNKIGPVAYDKWVAQYNSTCAIDDAAIWQFTSNGAVGGIAGRVDGNYAFKDYSQLIIPYGFLERKGNIYFYNNWKMQTGWVDYNNNRFFLDPLGHLIKGWLPQTDGTYYMQPSTGAMSLGFNLIGEATYYFGTNGHMVTGYQDINGGKYLFDGAGVMYRGWLNDGVNIRYFFEDGHMAYGLNNIANKMYFFDDQGNRKTGWVKIAGNDYFFNPVEGNMMTGWINDGTGNYYLAADGHKVVGFNSIEGSVYYLGTDGKMMTGFQEINGSTYLFMPDTGKMVTGFTTIGTSQYYFDPATGIMAKGFVGLANGVYHFDEKTGAMSVGVVSINNNFYYFNDKGINGTGWITIGANKYYFDPTNRNMKTGFINDGTGTYYLAEDGHMLTGVQTITGSVYYFNEKGQLQTGLVTINGLKYYFNPTTCALQTGFISDGVHTFYFAPDGHMLANVTEIIAGVTYQFDKNGYGTVIK